MHFSNLLRDIRSVCLFMIMAAKILNLLVGPEHVAHAGCRASEDVPVAPETSHQCV